MLHRYRHILGLWQPDIGPYGGLLNVVVSPRALRVGSCEVRTAAPRTELSAFSAGGTSAVFSLTLITRNFSSGYLFQPSLVLCRAAVSPPRLACALNSASQAEAPGPGVCGYTVMLSSVQLPGPQGRCTDAAVNTKSVPPGERWCHDPASLSLAPSRSLSPGDQHIL